MKAQEFLHKAASIMDERAKQYDQPNGERSMGKTVAAFENITGKRITEAEGWLFMEILKNVRQWQNPDQYHADSAEDGVAYSSLKAEALARIADQVHPKPGITDARTALLRICSVCHTQHTAREKCPTVDYPKAWKGE